MKKYDVKSTLLYALGRAIETEDDFEVRQQLEDLEEKMTDVPPMELKVPFIEPKSLKAEREVA